MAEAVLGVVLATAEPGRVHAALSMAAAAAALGRTVLLFATGAGCRALATELDAVQDAEFRALGVAGLAELREAGQALGMRVMVCDSALRLHGLRRDQLAPGVLPGGAATFLQELGAAQVISF